MPGRATGGGRGKDLIHFGRRERHHIASRVEHHGGDKPHEQHDGRVPEVEGVEQRLGDRIEAVDDGGPGAGLEQRVAGRGEDERRGTREAALPHGPDAHVGRGDDETKVGARVALEDERDEERGPNESERPVQISGRHGETRGEGDRLRGALGVRETRETIEQPVHRGR